jgi:hypothetical protein
MTPCRLLLLLLEHVLLLVSRRWCQWHLEPPLPNLLLLLLQWSGVYLQLWQRPRR